MSHEHDDDDHSRGESYLCDDDDTETIGCETKQHLSSENSNDTITTATTTATGDLDDYSDVIEEFCGGDKSTYDEDEYDEDNGDIFPDGIIGVEEQKEISGNTTASENLVTALLTEGIITADHPNLTTPSANELGCSDDRFFCSWNEMPAILPESSWRPIEICRRQSAVIARLERLTERLNGGAPSVVKRTRIQQEASNILLEEAVAAASSATSASASAASATATASIYESAESAVQVPLMSSVPMPTQIQMPAMVPDQMKRRGSKLSGEAVTELMLATAALREINDKIHECVMEYVRAAIMRGQIPEQLGYGTLLSCSQQFKDRMASAHVSSQQTAAATTTVKPGSNNNNEDGDNDNMNQDSTTAQLIKGTKPNMRGRGGGRGRGGATATAAAGRSPRGRCGRAKKINERGSVPGSSTTTRGRGRGSRGRGRLVVLSDATNDSAAADKNKSQMKTIDEIINDNFPQ